MTFKIHKLAATLLAALAILISGCMPEVHYLDRDVRDDVFYFVMPDRFENGDTSNDLGGLGGSAYDHGFDPYNKGMYHGGDLIGLENRLDYLKELGITAIWLTPILKNQAVQGSEQAFSSAYHGYWTLDFTQVDPHLGSNDDLKSLIDAAHDRNMKVFFDIITNHTADVIRYEECHEPDGTAKVNPCPYVSLAEKEAGQGLTPFVPAGLENAKVPEWLNDPQYYNNQGDSTFSGENSVYGDFVGLDDLDTTQPAVIDGMIAIFEDLVTEFKPDGFRIDTVKHVNIEFWQQFSPALITHAKSEGIPNFFMFGEVYDGNPEVLSYFTTVGKLQSVLDFGVQSAANAVFAYNGDTTILSNLFSQDDLYTDADSDASLLMNFGGNHDMGRMGMFIKNGNPNASDDELLARAELFNAFMFFARGIPVIYYGDEQGFTGDGGDQDARENMFPSLVESYNDNKLIGTYDTTASSNFDTEHPLFKAIAEYSDIYKQHSTLRYGSHVNRYSEQGGLYAFSRIDSGNREYLVVFNSGTEARQLKLAATSNIYQPVRANERLRADRNGEITINIAPLEFAIYSATRPIAFSKPSAFTLNGVIEGSAVAGRVNVELALSEALSALPTYEATFQISVNGGKNWKTIAKDRTAPYRLFWQTNELADGTEVILRAKLNNGQGKVTQQQVSLVIDSRVPETVSVVYENSNNRDQLYVSDHRGGLQGPIANNNGVFSFHWDENDDSQLLVFIDKQDDVFAIDKPILITRSNIVALSEENASGQLEAFVYLNNNGEFSQTENSVGGYAYELVLDEATEPPLGLDVNLRGGLNSWGVDPLTYVDNQTYKLQRLVNAGDVEFKFADSTWAQVNIGGPVTENGLVQGPNPGNLQQTFASKGLYNFYLVASEIDGQPVRLHFIEQEVGPLNEAIYLKGDMNGWSEQTPFTYLGNNTYQLDVQLDAGNYNFKIANANWSWERSTNGAVVIDAENAVVAAGGNSTVTAENTANYSFTYNLSTETLMVRSDYVSPNEPGLLVVFQKPESWANNVNIYFWEAATTQTPAWPGVQMTDLGDGWFSYQFNEGTAAANIIFNDGGNQTANLFRDQDGCFIDGLWQNSCPPYLGDAAPVETLSVRFQAPSSWTTVSVHYWETAPVNLATNWPGATATRLYGDWWTFDFPAGVETANLIFNNGGAGEQTSNLSRNSDGCYRWDTLEWSDNCAVSMTVTFKKPAAWSNNMNVYYWNASAISAGWPGESMTLIENDLYSYSFPDGVFSANLIFNDGSGNQTADLFRDADGCFAVDIDAWSTSCVLP